MWGEREIERRLLSGNGDPRAALGHLAAGRTAGPEQGADGRFGQGAAEDEALDLRDLRVRRDELQELDRFDTFHDDAKVQ